MVDGHQGWPEQLCRSGPAALDRLACFYYYYYYYSAFKFTIQDACPEVHMAVLRAAILNRELER